MNGILKDKKWLPISMLWGHLGVINNERDKCYVVLYFFDATFNSKEEAEADYQSFDGNSKYTGFFKDIFADG